MSQPQGPLYLYDPDVDWGIVPEPWECEPDWPDWEPPEEET